MFREVTGEDQDVIKVDKHEVIQKVSQDVIDEGLEDGGVIEAERHDQVFKEAKWALFLLKTSPRSLQTEGTEVKSREEKPEVAS